MNRLALSLPAMMAAFAIAAAPVAQAQSVTAKFKEELAKKVGNKSGNGAAKAAAKTIAKYVVAPTKGDPKKLLSFTKLGIKAIKGRNADVGFVSAWSQFSMFSYFKKGLKSYDPSDKGYAKAQKVVYALIKGDQSNAQKSYEKLKKNNKKLKGTEADLGILAEEVSKAAKVDIES